MSFVLHRLRKRIWTGLGLTADWALFIGIVLIGGFGSSWYMVEAGSLLTTVRVGPWTTWTAAARSDADPYTRAHYARLGVLPLSAEYAQTYIARTDSDGRSLHSSCDYEIEGHEIPTHWWSMTVFDAKGRLIQNVAERYTFTSDTIALEPDGTFIATLARDARPGNWLPVGGAGRLAIAFSVVDLGIRAVAREGEIEELLPVIKRKKC
jgi:hypothetical protein